MSSPNIYAFRSLLLPQWDISIRAHQNYRQSNNDSSSSHIKVKNFSLKNSLRTWSLRNKIIKLMALFTILVFSTCVRCAYIIASSFNVLIHFSRVKICYICTFHIPKLFSPKNLLISHLEPMVPTCKQNSFALRW